MCHIQLVTPSVVPSAVRIEIRICTTIFQVSFFISFIVRIFLKKTTWTTFYNMDNLIKLLLRGLHSFKKLS